MLLYQFINLTQKPGFFSTSFLSLFSDKSRAYTKGVAIRVKCVLTESETATWMKLSRMEELSWSITSITGLSSSCERGGGYSPWENESFPPRTPPRLYTKQNCLQDTMSFSHRKGRAKTAKGTDDTPRASELSLSSVRGRSFRLLDVAQKSHILEFQKHKHAPKNLNLGAGRHSLQCVCVVVNFRERKPHGTMLCQASKVLLTEVTDPLT